MTARVGHLWDDLGINGACEHCTCGGQQQATWSPAVVHTGTTQEPLNPQHRTAQEMDFIAQLAEANSVPETHPVVQYLMRKTRAVDRGSKARRSLGNLYALKVLAESYLHGRASRFTDLLASMRALPFGAKLQNHPLDNRLNDEFGRQLGVEGAMLPVQDASAGGPKARVISQDLLSADGCDPKSTAKFIVDTVNAYVELITSKQSNALDEIESVESVQDLKEFFEEAFLPTSDARLFEVASYVLLAEHFRAKAVYIGDSVDSVKKQVFRLFRTGRTNANDGGIDFVLTPLGRFFQVTETLDFRKYFLDFEKVNRFPLSFVVKVSETAIDVRHRIQRDAERSGLYQPEVVRGYMSLFEQIYTLVDLEAIAASVEATAIDRIKSELLLQFKLEYGLLD